MSETTVFCARQVLTMDANMPQATHVAVRDGRILAVGDASCADPWGGGQLDTRFADAVIAPGFVEGHAHLMEGGLWRYTYVGFMDRLDPQGQRWPGVTRNEEVIARLREVATHEPTIGWGFDPIFISQARLNRDMLDQVSTERPVAVLFSSLHLMVCNTAALRSAGYLEAGDVEGLMRDAQGRPTGELREMAAMFPVLRRLGVDFRRLAAGPEVLRAYGASARRAGVTTATDLFSSLTVQDVDATLEVVQASDFPIRLVPAVGVVDGDPVAIARDMAQMRQRSTSKLRMGAVKLMTDGSIQGFSARLQWPGYLGGVPNGMWNTPPEVLRGLIAGFHASGTPMHIHVNGNEASAVTLEALAHAMAGPGPRDHRHTLQHGQLMDEAQFRRAAALGVGVNLFANHIYYFGDQHVAHTVGLERAQRMNACRSALEAGVNLAIHSDAPVTPLAPLFTAWCAVQRQTASGRVLGQAQAITPAQALRAITLGAAWSLNMDHEVGSIEVGKRADMVVLQDNPLTVPPSAIKDIAVRATVLGGQVFEAGA